ncbi:uncharacterized protein AB675_5542 [Cyphellophora attinorum]|uniref:Transcription factor domain-containing protein n=1 Tax=Cyphellophora attinorum TaxID=1664694 RepID=A0A0N1HD24_9EURO|nr:uncharacterized protein AB675_5542 [Phialophora attinorum]KPI42046.1 hypothetical protein AB675_5542 [Phialophora attinorum]
MKQVLFFIRTAWIPATHRAKKDDVIHVVVQNLFKSQLASATTLPYLTMISKLSGSPISKVDSLKNKAKVIQLLKKEQSASLAISLGASLFAAAAVEGNFEEARIHSAALQVAVGRFMNRGFFDPDATHEELSQLMRWVIHHLVFNELQISHSTSTKSVLGLEWLVEAYAKSEREPCSTLIDPVLHESFICGLEKSTHDPFGDICDNLRESLCMLHQKEPTRAADSPTKALRDSLYETIQRRQTTYWAWVRLACERFPDLHVQASFIYAILAYSATFATGPRLQDKYGILSQLRCHLSYVKLLEDPKVLFSYWIGATWEHNEAMDFYLEDKWFTRGLVQLSSNMGIDNWSSLKATIDQSMPADLAQPNGSIWFDDEIRMSMAFDEG